MSKVNRAHLVSLSAAYHPGAEKQKMYVFNVHTPLPWVRERASISFREWTGKMENAFALDPFTLILSLISVK